MGEVELPVVDIDASVTEAFDALEAGGTAAIVVADGAEHRLVFGGALLLAEEANAATLRDVETQPLPAETADEVVSDDEASASAGCSGTAIRYFTEPPGGGFFSVDGFRNPRRSATLPSFSLRAIGGQMATVVTAHEYSATSLARPDFFRCTIYPLQHTFPDPPPDVDDGVVCPKCKRDPAIRTNGVVKLYKRI